MNSEPQRPSAGTQVVVQQESVGSNGRAIHPVGAVGIIVRTPVGTETGYAVRFHDGFEVTLPREGFEILKHFKDHLPSSASAEEVFDLESLVVFSCVVGSRAYGLDTEESDTDVRGVYVAPAEMLWSLFGAPEQFEDGEAQSCHWELQKFLTMALKANPNILECLYSPLVEKVTPVGEALLALRERFLSRVVFQTFNGYALSQFKKLEQDLRNQGSIRWKHAMHLLRLLLTGAATLREGRVPVRVEAHRERLLAVKRGELAWSKVDDWRKELHREFEAALASTRLPPRPDYEAVNHFLIETRRDQARNGQTLIG
ncbi:nucleotidyltransferase domain-containing protein [Synoicihabitans lomoniglobus]|uniref:Nucleotidyltransferase domain-containing protein n=1 Tax=Synoicihabitans lomoniglobus TaxID=2909285 RepID=A0AAE9ZX43_9BACT|nr:nucleotidyltransferase domain-containing protein [Opitutaceae bacterium LMO-M01]WED65081.1 nucleotidyltransferase domain-containing protein [Opitutaceae bacterium LMO-M01]